MPFSSTARSLPRNVASAGSIVSPPTKELSTAPLLRAMASRSRRATPAVPAACDRRSPTSQFAGRFPDDILDRGSDGTLHRKMIPFTWYPYDDLSAARRVRHSLALRVLRTPAFRYAISPMVNSLTPNSPIRLAYCTSTLPSFHIHRYSFQICPPFSLCTMTR